MELVLTKAELQLQSVEINKAALILRAINHSLRQQMLHLIHQHGKLTVKEIYGMLRLEQSVASQHFAILRKGLC